jgi:co-chaperonin GroES (HSP10)
MGFRPLNDCILVELEPLPEKWGSIIVAHREPRIRTAFVKAVGPGRCLKSGKRAAIPLERGERVAFLAMHLDTPKGAQLTQTLRELGSDIGVIQDRDILFVVPPGENPTLE